MCDNFKFKFVWFIFAKLIAFEISSINDRGFDHAQKLQLQKFINIGRGLNKTVWLDKNTKINKDSSLNWNWKETNQIPDSFLPKNKLLYPVYAGDRNSDDEVFITNIIPKTESISYDESTLPSAFPAKDSHRVEEGNGSTG